MGEMATGQRSVSDLGVFEMGMTEDVFQFTGEEC